MTNTSELAKACLAAATALQQIAAALEGEPPNWPPVVPGRTMGDALAEAHRGFAVAIDRELAAALEAEPAELETPARPASMYRDRGPLDEPPASVAEPECGCSLYARCDQHEAERPKLCRCNGPDFPSSRCPILEHRSLAGALPERDPALVD